MASPLEMFLSKIIYHYTHYHTEAYSGIISGGGGGGGLAQNLGFLPLSQHFSQNCETMTFNSSQMSKMLRLNITWKS